ncbi:RNA polymerase sigma factor, sigma-70 family protein 12 [Achromobacter xylosoxidans A8]|uniref:RNA polymerase sigma factor, sigma-70 family protein 12 n=1 Tax=Achromobacter xylosoxidans (strain A8) TaxID=762376 RepID=E3HKH9_ACHXA|nr:RNA polymerase sigma factor [Achromobacter xylosoxidans]ADP19267.1 RNA polymerase sigma factor, sigma-70 family protein 12 [Achromobacter xylosoxidans A8]
MTALAALAATPAEDEDLALAHRIAGGEQTAFELMMRRHNRRLYRLARATLRNDADAEDALQETYLAAYRHMAAFRGESTLFTWLSRLLLNECYGRLRKHNRREALFPIADDIEKEVDAMTINDFNPPYHAAARAELRGLLEARLDALPVSFRTVFVLRSVEELSVEETAHCLGIPEATVRSRHFRANALLRESLARDVGVVEKSLFEFDGDDCDRVVERTLARLGESSKN